MPLGSLRGLRVQLLLWTVLPLTLVMVAVAVIGLTTHQHAMRDLVEELDARSARLAAARLSDGLQERATALEMVAHGEKLTANTPLLIFFDGGVARLRADGSLLEAFPSAEAWVSRPLAALRQASRAPSPMFGRPVAYSPLFLDSATGRNSLLVGLQLENGNWLVGAVSLEQLGLAQIVSQAGAGEQFYLQSGHTSLPPGEAVAFLVDAEGNIIYHPDPMQIGRNVRTHEGVAAILQGRAGATYHQETDGQEWVVGYAPVRGPGWGLIVQEPWERLIAPVMRLSLLTPVLVAAAALLSGVAVTFGLRYIVHPLQALDRQAARVAWGDFSAVREPVGGVQEMEDLRRTLEGMATQIQRYQTGMRDYIAAVTMAQEAERQRLARELHDETVQSLIALGHRIEMAQKALGKDPERARQRLAELQTMVGDIQAEVRRFSRALRPLYLEDLGFVPALKMLAQETERDHRLAVEVVVEGDVRRLPADMELTIYRIAQEGLSNVVRHARATSARLAVTFAADALTLQLRDNGTGFASPRNPADLARAGHFGLMGIHERALLFGGSMEIESTPGAGTTLTVRLPLPAASSTQK